MSTVTGGRLPADPIPYCAQCGPLSAVFEDGFADVAQLGFGTRRPAPMRLCCEPWPSVVDFVAVVAARPADHNGGFMIEVGQPSVDSRLESHRRSNEWASEQLPIQM
jgi:hypothetical protein